MNPSWIHYITMCLLYLPVFPSVCLPHQLITKKEIPIHSSYITIEKNYTYNTVSSGIAVWNSNNIIIDGNEVELACNDGEQECITVAVTHTFELIFSCFPK